MCRKEKEGKEKKEEGESEEEGGVVRTWHYTLSMHVTLLHSVVSTYLPCRIVVSKIDEVLHEPGVDLTQCQTLFWRLQDCLGQTDRQTDRQTGRQLKVDYIHLTATRSHVYLSGTPWRNLIQSITTTIFLFPAEFLPWKSPTYVYVSMFGPLPAL